MKITFKYKTTQDTEWVNVKISPTDFFDLDEANNYNIDSSQKYWHFHEYIDIEPIDLMFVCVKIEDKSNVREYKQTYWNEGCNIIIERIDEGEKQYRELIVSTVNNLDKASSQTVRFVVADVILPVYNGYFVENVDGSQSEDKLDLSTFSSLV